VSGAVTITSVTSVTSVTRAVNIGRNEGLDPKQTVTRRNELRFLSREAEACGCIEKRKRAATKTLVELNPVELTNRLQGLRVEESRKEESSFLAPK
jgi:hypothetical protein